MLVGRMSPHQTFPGIAGDVGRDRARRRRLGSPVFLPRLPSAIDNACRCLSSSFEGKPINVVYVFVRVFGHARSFDLRKTAGLFGGTGVRPTGC